MRSSPTDRLTPRPPGVVAIQGFLAITVNISAVVGNLLVFVAVYRNPRLRKSSSVYIICLAVTDFSMGVLVFPINVISIITGKFPGGTALCWFQAILSFYFAAVSILTMAVIAVQRYFKIVKPNKYKDIFTLRFFAWSIALIWFVVAVMVTILAFTGNDVHFHEEFPICMVNMSRISVAMFLDVLCVALPCLLMSLLYFKIWRFIRSHNSQMNHSNVNAEEVKLTKSLLIVVGTFAACYTPFTIALSLIVYEVYVPREIQFFSLCAVAFASVVNPIIYGVMNKEFRAEFSKIIRCSWTIRTTRIEPVIHS